MQKILINPSKIKNSYEYIVGQNIFSKLPNFLDLNKFSKKAVVFSMVDASIGGKNGFNFSKIKNCIGTIYQPNLVLVDINFLNKIITVKLLILVTLLAMHWKFFL